MRLNKEDNKDLFTTIRMQGGGFWVFSTKKCKSCKSDNKDMNKM